MEKYLRAHRWIFGADLLLNWGLGFWLLVGNADQVLMQNSPVLQPIVYRLIGLGFLVFALWQSWQLRKPISPAALQIAYWMAILPILALGIALIIFNNMLRPIPRILLWLGELYMFFLSVWYSRILTLLRK